MVRVVFRDHRVGRVAALCLWMASSHQPMKVKFVRISFAVHLRHYRFVIVISDWRQNSISFHSFSLFSPFLTSALDSICRSSCSSCSFSHPIVGRPRPDRLTWTPRRYLRNARKSSLKHRTFCASDEKSIFSAVRDETYPPIWWNRNSTNQRAAREEIAIIVSAPSPGQPICVSHSEVDTDLRMRRRRTENYSWD